MRYLLLVFIMIYCSFFNFPFANAKDTTDEYTIGVGDVLDINVINEPSLNTTTTVTIDGTITFPLIGSFRVEGLKLSAIEEEITRRLSQGYIKYPVVSVSLIKTRGLRFYVYGGVPRPGMFLFEENITVLRALSMAGGISSDGLYGKVKLRRKQEGEPDYKDMEIDLKGTIEGSTKGDMPIQQDDIVIVERNKTYFVHGEVGRPGEYVLENDMTVVKAISLAGGIAPSGLYGKVKVRRKQEGEPDYKDIEIDLKGTIEGSTKGDMPIQQDDIVIIERNKIYFVYGEFNNTGEYVLKDDITALKAITIAGGFTKWGSPSRIKILRLRDDGAGYVTIKVNINAVINGDSTADIKLQSEDIVVAYAGII